MQRAYGSMPLVGDQAAAFTGVAVGFRVDNGTPTREGKTLSYYGCPVWSLTNGNHQPNVDFPETSVVI